MDHRTYILDERGHISNVIELECLTRAAQGGILPSLQTKRPPEGGLSADMIAGSDDAKCSSLVTTAIGHETHAEEAKDHHGPGRGLGHGRNRQGAAVAG
jgi:hypothetical protein